MRDPAIPVRNYSRRIPAKAQSVVEWAMSEETDLLPWILGGTLALGAVAATALGLSDPTGPPTAPGVAAVSTPQVAPSATPAAHPALPVDLSPVVVSPTARQQLPPGQVWECDVDGRRVFSDTQCGAHATVRQLSELNVIDSSAAYAHVAPRPYAPGYYSQPGPGYDRDPGPASDTPTDDSDANDPIYTGTPVIVARDRSHRDQLAHRDNHPRPRPARPRAARP
jgi:hypothetical protein